MQEYLLFIKKYGTFMQGEIQYEEYIDLKQYVTDMVIKIVDTKAYNNINIEECISFIMFYLLKNVEYDEIMEFGYVNQITSAVTYFYKNNKTKSNNNTLNGNYYIQDKAKVVNTIKSFLENIKIIFTQEVNLDELANDIYESLLFDGYTKEDILKHKCNNTILKYIRDGFFEIKFTEEFKNFKNRIINQTSSIFAKNKIELIRQNRGNVRNNRAYIYYDDPNFQRDVAFKATLNFYLSDIRPNQVNNEYLDNYIRNYMEKDMIKINSTRRKVNKKITEEKIKKAVSHKKTQEEKDNRKKKAIIFGIIVGTFVIDNLLYMALNNEKPENEQEKFPKNYYATNTAYNSSNNNINYNYENNEIVLGGENSVRL